jgi:hypothetical protein
MILGDKRVGHVARRSGYAQAIGVRPTQLTIKQSALQKFRPSYDLLQNLHEC